MIAQQSSLPTVPVNQDVFNLTVLFKHINFHPKPHTLVCLIKCAFHIFIQIPGRIVGEKRSRVFLSAFHYLLINVSVQLGIQLANCSITYAIKNNLINTDTVKDFEK